MGFYCYGISKGGVRRMRDINAWRLDLHPRLFIEEETPSEKKKDASLWRKRKISAPSPFIRGTAMKQYREIIEAENEK